jgi:hypothetical protein
VKIKVYGRLSFPDIWTARVQGDEGEPKFACDIIILPNHPCIAVAERAIDTAGKEKWKEKWEKMQSDLDSKGRLCLHKTPKTNMSGDVYDGYEDMYWVRATSKVRPKIRDADGKTDVREVDGKMYSGCRVVGILDVFGHFHAKGGNRVLAQLKGLQYAGEGDSFGGGAPASDSDFEPVEIPEDAAELV